MQPFLYPIAYSGISDTDFEDFAKTGKLPLACKGPTFVEKRQSIAFTGITTAGFGRSQFLVQNDDIFEMGYSTYPWTLEVNWRDINTDYGYKHWGGPIANYLGDFNKSSSTYILDPKARSRGDTNLILCVKNGIPVLVEYDRFTSLLQYNVNQYALYSTNVQHCQWIMLPTGEEKILLIVNNTLYFITIMSEHSSYPIIGAPTAVPELSWIPASIYATYTSKNVNASTYRMCNFYYHNGTLCFYVSERSGGGSYPVTEYTNFYSYNSDIDKFVQDYSLGFASELIYYSSYNQAVNLLCTNTQFLGDYRWYIVTPISDLSTYFQTTAIRGAILFAQSPYNYNGENASSFFISAKESGDTVYFFFLHNNGGNGVRLDYFSFVQPLITTALLNVHLGEPNAAITGKFQIEGDLFYPDFRWEVASKQSYKVYTGSPELYIKYPSIINLRLTPSMPQDISNLIREPLDTSEYPLYPLRYIPEYKTKPYYEIQSVDAYTTEIKILYGMIYNFYNHVEMSISTSVPEVAPFVFLSKGNTRIRHCSFNTGTFCYWERPEYKTINCNENCDWYHKSVILLDILPNGEDVTYYLTDERETFAPYDQIAHVDVRLK